MNVNLHLTHRTQLHPDGYALDDRLLAEVGWGFSAPGSRLGKGTLWGTPAMLRQLAELAIHAAIQAEEEACWQARQAAGAAAEVEGSAA